MKTRGNESFRRRNSKLVPRLLLLLGLIVAVALITLFCVKFVAPRLKNSNTVSSLYRNWKKYDYEKVYDISAKILEKKPLHNTARTFYGYSAFYLAVSETDSNLAQSYLDESINSLRIALQSSKKKSLGQIEYMLGKAYFYKNSISSYDYYADLAVKYFQKSLDDRYKSDDVWQYLGLSYAALGKRQESIASFTKALDRESDVLLMNIAEQYYLNGQSDAAKQYLFRCNNISQNQDILSKSHTLLGQIYTDESKYEDAFKEFNAVLEKDKNSADAHYGLGVLYEKQGDIAKARSEWRKCIRIQVNHPGAAKKMAEIK